MRRRLAPLIGVLGFTILALNTLFWAGPIYVVGALKLIPIPAWRRRCSRTLIWCGERWVRGNDLIWALNAEQWHLSLPDNLENSGWYLVVSNHLSWVDIFVLQRVFNRRIPFLKFFIKRELIWVPVIGLAWWAMDFPFMKRHSREYLKRHPEKRGEDLETTRRFCRRFQNTSISIFNFLEGTRYRPAKHAAQESPYRHLLRPKAGGIAFTLAAMGEKLNTLLNVTLAYPDGIPEFGDFLSGQVRRVVVEVESVTIPAHFARGDYANDPAFRTEFQTWVNDLWADKDQQVEQILSRHGASEHVLA